MTMIIEPPYYSGSLGSPSFSVSSNEENHPMAVKTGVKRKREKLDHLTEEEKLLRRKLKNRISAQTARDRKKEKVCDLEAKVNQLNRQKNDLYNENISLKRVNKTLEQENSELRKRLSDTLLSPTVKPEIDSFESAEEPGIEEGSFINLDKAIDSLISSNGDECEEVLKWLHECSKQLLDTRLDQFADDSGIEDSGSVNGEEADRLSQESASSQQSLESIRDLISSDHLYYRSSTPVEVLSCPEITVTSSPDAPDEELPPQLPQQSQINFDELFDVNYIPQDSTPMNDLLDQLFPDLS